MNFFERQQAVRAQSRRLIALFMLAVAGIVLVVDLALLVVLGVFNQQQTGFWETLASHRGMLGMTSVLVLAVIAVARSEEHTSELQSLMRISYAVFCLKKKKRYLRTADDT